KVVAVAVVAQAVWGMGRNLCPDTPRATIAVLSACAALAFSMPAAQAAVIVAGGLAGLAFLRAETGPRHAALESVAHKHVALGSEQHRGLAVASLATFFVLLIGLPLLAAAYPSQTLAVID